MKNKKEPLNPWELREMQNRPKTMFGRVWRKIKAALIWIGAALAAAFDFVISLF